jgi:hypothetical protein
MYNQVMEKVYRKCYDSLDVGGVLVVIIQDMIRNQKRVYLSNWVIKVCEDAGFQILDRFKRYSRTQFKSMRKARGENVVEDEDILMFIKV